MIYSCVTFVGFFLEKIKVVSAIMVTNVKYIYIKYHNMKDKYKE